MRKKDVRKLPTLLDTVIEADTVISMSTARPSSSATESTTSGKLLSLTELAQLALHLTSTASVKPSSGRAHYQPDARMIRYYTTRGLIDKPITGSDRKARYGRRHLVQFMAVKRLQSQGQSLAAAAASLAGLSTDQLSAIAAIAPTLLPPDLADGSTSPPQPHGFWTAPEPTATSSVSPAQSQTYQQLTYQSKTHPDTALPPAAPSMSPPTTTCHSETTHPARIGSQSSALLAANTADTTITPTTQQLYPSSQRKLSLSLWPGAELLISGIDQLDPCQQAKVYELAKPLLAYAESLSLSPPGHTHTQQQAATNPATGLSTHQLNNA